MNAPATKAMGGSTYTSQLSPLGGGEASTRSPYWATKYSSICACVHPNASFSRMVSGYWLQASVGHTSSGTFSHTGQYSPLAMALTSSSLGCSCCARAVALSTRSNSAARAGPTSFGPLRSRTLGPHQRGPGGRSPPAPLRLLLRPGRHQRPQDEYPAPHPHEVHQRVLVDLEGGPLLGDRLPADQQHVEVILQAGAHAGDGHGLILGNVEVLPREEPSDGAAVPEDRHFGPGDVASIRRAELAEAVVDQDVAPQGELLAPGQGALGLALEHLDAQDADSHQHDTQVDHIAPIALPAAAGQPPQPHRPGLPPPPPPPHRQRQALPVAGVSGRCPAPELIQGDQGPQPGQPVSEQRRRASQ